LSLYLLSYNPALKHHNWSVNVTNAYFHLCGGFANQFDEVIAVETEIGVGGLNVEVFVRGGTSEFKLLVFYDFF
jgi:hypothetical protein